MRYIVLLDGVNIGSRTIKSDELKNFFPKSDSKYPQTILALENVVIESRKSAASEKN